MTSLRSADLQSFLTLAEATISHGYDVDGRVRVTADRVFSALQAQPAKGGPPQAVHLPVCQHLPTALEHARRQPGPVGDRAVVDEPVGHANATIIGSEGLEIRRDVWIGASLLAPHTRYPDHRHPPEEIYVVLSGGQWRQASNPWHEPGVGGFVYNPPNIVHAMRSTERPLLALWFLWTEQANA